MPTKIRSNQASNNWGPLDRPNITKTYQGVGSKGYISGEALPSSIWNGIFDDVYEDIHDNIGHILDNKAAGDKIGFYEWETYEGNRPQIAVIGDTKIRRQCWAFSKISGGHFYYGTDTALYGGTLLLKFVVSATTVGNAQFIVEWQQFADGSAFTDTAASATVTITHDGTANKQYFKEVDLGSLSPGLWTDIHVYANNEGAAWTLAEESDGSENVYLFGARLF